MNIFESLENLNVSEECFNDLYFMIREDLETMAVKKYGQNSKQRHKAADIADKAYGQAQEYFSKKGANHDLSQKNDKNAWNTIDKIDNRGEYALDHKLDYEEDPSHKEQLELAQVDRARDRHIGNEIRKKGLKN